MYLKIFDDPDLCDFFKKTNKQKQKEMQREFLTFATGGAGPGSEWHGKSMEAAHAGRGIKTFEFDRVALHVVTTL
jgi:truncated hemoglobin YjbI